MDSLEIINCIKQEIISNTDKSPESFNENVNFLRLGISSIQTLKIINRLQKKLNIEINPVAMFEYKTIAQFAEFLSSCMNSTSHSCNEQS